MAVEAGVSGRRSARARDRREESWHKGSRYMEEGREEGGGDAEARGAVQFHG